MHQSLLCRRMRASLSRLAAATAAASLLFLAGDAARAGDVVWNQFNVVSLGDLTTNQDVEGTVFVGGNLSTNGGATQIPSSYSVTYPASQYTVNVAGSITSGSTVHVEQGSLLLGGSASGATVNFNGGGSLTPDTNNTLSGQLASLATQLTSASNAYSALATNPHTVLSTVTYPSPSDQPAPANFNAVANSNGVAVFTIDASFFSDSKIQQVNLNLGAGVKDIVIDVTGSGTINEASLNFVGNWGNSSVRATTIWNFAPTITNINLQNEFPGAILAPDAALVTGNTAVDGSVFAKSITANGEIHLPYFDGFVPAAVPEPSSIVLAGFGLFGAGLLAWRRRAAARPSA
jgi:choice-of-anchor A domain-containing protein